MRTLLTTIVLFGMLAGGATSARAQTPEGPDHSPALALKQEELIKLEDWIRDFSEWKAWMVQWGNRREPGWLSGSRARRLRPAPPEWLFDRCDESPEDSTILAEACILLDEWRTDYATLRASGARTAVSANDEDSGKTTWLEHLHLDVGWPAMQSGMSLFGVVGVHATTSVRGRLKVFIAPGAMLLNVPTRDGARAWKIATNYGIAYRLTQFRVPGGRQALLHVNLAKAWLLNAGPDVPAKSTDFIGFSLTFRNPK